MLICVLLVHVASFKPKPVDFSAGSRNLLLAQGPYTYVRTSDPRKIEEKFHNDAVTVKLGLKRFLFVFAKNQSRRYINSKECQFFL